MGSTSSCLTVGITSKLCHFLLVVALSMYVCAWLSDLLSQPTVCRLLCDLCIQSLLQEQLFYFSRNCGPTSPPLFLDGSDSSHLYCSACSLAWRWISFFAIITVLFPKCQCSSPMLFLWPVPAAFWIFWTHCRVELVYSLRLPVCLSSILLLTGTTQENGGLVLVSLSLFPLLSLSLSICASDSLCFFSFLEW